MFGEEMVKKMNEMITNSTRLKKYSEFWTHSDTIKEHKWIALNSKRKKNNIKVQTFHWKF